MNDIKVIEYFDWFLIFKKYNSIVKTLMVKKKPILFKSMGCVLKIYVHGAGLEPAREKISQDFKSCASTNSAIRAKEQIQN